MTRDIESLDNAEFACYPSAKSRGREPCNPLSVRVELYDLDFLKSISVRPNCASTGFE